jgi:hypothetical protein
MNRVLANSSFWRAVLLRFGYIILYNKWPMQLFCVQTISTLMIHQRSSIASWSSTRFLLLKDTFLLFWGKFSKHHVSSVLCTPSQRKYQGPAPGPKKFPKMSLAIKAPLRLRWLNRLKWVVNKVQFSSDVTFYF